LVGWDYPFFREATAITHLKKISITLEHHPRGYE
jgi:hypothetical protein